MPIYLIDKIKQKNNGTFKLIDASDVEYNGKGLDEAIQSGEFKGESAYETWLKQPGNEGKSEEEFLNSLKGDSISSTLDYGTITIKE